MRRGVGGVGGWAGGAGRLAGQKCEQALASRPSQTAQPPTWRGWRAWTAAFQARSVLLGAAAGVQQPHWRRAGGVGREWGCLLPREPSAMDDRLRANVAAALAFESSRWQQAAGRAGSTAAAHPHTDHIALPASTEPSRRHTAPALTASLEGVDTPAASSLAPATASSRASISHCPAAAPARQERAPARRRSRPLAGRVPVACRPTQRARRVRDECWLASQGAWAAREGVRLPLAAARSLAAASLCRLLFFNAPPRLLLHPAIRKRRSTRKAAAKRRRPTKQPRSSSKAAARGSGSGGSLAAAAA